MWRCGNVEMWRCGNVEIWKCGNVKMRRCGDVEMWKCEDVRMWGSLFFPDSFLNGSKLRSLPSDEGVFAFLAYICD